MLMNLNKIIQKSTGTLKCEYGITPSYLITFTCQRCSNRTTHRMTKQAYCNGTVIIQCPHCKNRHLISDHLKIFSDKSVTIEDIMKEKGKEVCRSHGGFSDSQSGGSINDHLLLSRPKNE
ncbi:hypothetical protein PCANB_001360 [Pneumocystis canis]|nr:hypothetical protein PCANB_001360 [Pneumocystis canis]